MLISQERPGYRQPKGKSCAILWQALAALELVFGPGNQALLLMAGFPLIHLSPPSTSFMEQLTTTGQAGTKL